MVICLKGLKTPTRKSLMQGSGDFCMPSEWKTHHLNNFLGSFSKSRSTNHIFRSLGELFLFGRLCVFLNNIKSSSIPEVFVAFRTPEVDEFVK